MYTRYEFDTNNGNLFPRKIIYSNTYNAQSRTKVRAGQVLKLPGVVLSLI